MHNVTETKEKLLSICIPTFKREYLIPELLDSIYSQDIDNSIFEVCISDNSPTDETKKIIEEQYSDYKNLIYKKSECNGFLNSIEALKLGSGSFLKLHNDYSIFKKDSLKKIINLIEQERNLKPQIFFALNALPKRKNLESFSNFDSFLKYISYYSSWSSSFSIWKSDFDKILSENIIPNYMFPHSTLLFHCNYKTKYIVDNDDYVNNRDPKEKGGYNLLDNFVRIYLQMVKSDLLSSGVISNTTYSTLQNGILQFCARWYSVANHSKNYTFSFENKIQIIKEECGFSGLIKFYMNYFLYYIVHSIKKLLGKKY